MIHNSALVLVILVALLHLYFFYLESFQWTKPRGLRTFGMTFEIAQQSEVLAANQGVYNFVLALGLFASFFFVSPEIAFAFRLFFLGSVVIVGTYGALSIPPPKGRRIFFIQAMPAILALCLLLF